MGPGRRGRGLLAAALLGPPLLARADPLNNGALGVLGVMGLLLTVIGDTLTIAQVPRGQAPPRA
ncbi:MAG: hypothetical protein ACRYFR_03290 [Janthinobacterium lividum]